jgi:hypothetical protein
VRLAFDWVPQKQEHMIGPQHYLSRKTRKPLAFWNQYFNHLIIKSTSTVYSSNPFVTLVCVFDCLTFTHLLSSTFPLLRPLSLCDFNVTGHFRY